MIPTLSVRNAFALPLARLLSIRFVMPCMPGIAPLSEGNIEKTSGAASSVNSISWMFCARITLVPTLPYR